MEADLTALWQRERKRREVLWTLEDLRPGAEEAIPLLALLDEIDRLDREKPLGDFGLMSIEELHEFVPQTPFTGSDGYPFVLVLDQHIPQPWRARFEEASALSTRLREGSYASDWRRFLRVWTRDMQHLAVHRQRLKIDSV